VFSEAEIESRQTLRRLYLTQPHSQGPLVLGPLSPPLSRHRGIVGEGPGNDVGYNSAQTPFVWIELNLRVRKCCEEPVRRNRKLLTSQDD